MKKNELKIGSIYNDGRGSMLKKIISIDGNDVTYEVARSRYVTLKGQIRTCTISQFASWMYQEVSFKE